MDCMDVHTKLSALTTMDCVHNVWSWGARAGGLWWDLANNHIVQLRWALGQGWYVSKNQEFCIKNQEFCIKTEEFCIKNQEFCIKTEEFRSSTGGAGAVTYLRQFTEDYPSYAILDNIGVYFIPQNYTLQHSPEQVSSPGEARGGGARFHLWGERRGRCLPRALYLFWPIITLLYMSQIVTHAT